MAWWGRVWSGRWVSGKSLCSWWWTQFSLEQEDPNRTGLCGSPRADSCNADSDGVRRLQAAARGANKEGPIATLRAESCRRNCPGSDEEILSSCEDRRSPQSRLLHLEQRNVYEAREEQKINTNPPRAWTHHDSNVTESVRIRPAHEHRWGEKTPVLICFGQKDLFILKVRHYGVTLRVRRVPLTLLSVSVNWYTVHGVCFCCLGGHCNAAAHWTKCGILKSNEKLLSHPWHRLFECSAQGKTADSAVVISCYRLLTSFTTPPHWVVCSR